MADTTTLVDELTFPEGPRWREGRWYFSDFYSHQVLSVDPTGDARVECQLNQQPSGLGWAPNGDLLVVGMNDRQVLRRNPAGELERFADLTEHTTHLANDMLVLPDGSAFVGNFGFDLDTFLDTYGPGGIIDPGAPTTNLCHVSTAGEVTIAATEMCFPNGMVLADGGQTLIVAETLAMRLTAFDLAADGSLTNRRIWADLGNEFIAPDGIAIDKHGHVWVANAVGQQAVGIAEGGAIVATVATSQTCFAVQIGGNEGGTIACCTAASSHHAEASAHRTGRIEIAPVPTH